MSAPPEAERAISGKLDEMEYLFRTEALGPIPNAVYELAFYGLRVRVLTGEITDEQAPHMAMARLSVLAEEGVGANVSREDATRVLGILKARDDEFKTASQRKVEEAASP